MTEADPSAAAGAPALSVFDLDRTITRRGTYLAFLVHAAVRLHPWRLTALPLVAAAMAAHALGGLSRTRLKEVMHRLLLGPRLGEDAARRLAAGFAARRLADGVYPQARAQIAAERAQGRIVVIATAAPELYARPLADGLGVLDLVATRAVWRGGRLLSRIDGLNCHGAEKLARFERFVAGRGLEGAHVRFFSDDASDRPMFERCDGPVAVNPTRALRRLAQARGWPVLDWRRRSAASRDAGAGR